MGEEGVRGGEPLNGPIDINRRRRRLLRQVPLLCQVPLVALSLPALPIESQSPWEEDHNGTFGLENHMSLSIPFVKIVVSW